METKQKSEMNKEQLIKGVRERLDWYNFQASPEEFNEAEVAALIDLLKVMDTEAVEQVPDVNEAYEKFQQYMSMREEDGERLAVLRGGKVAAQGRTAGAGRKMGKRFFRHGYRYAAAILAAVLVIGGTAGAVNAEKYQGVFHWLFKNDSGAAVVITPPKELATEVIDKTVYYSEEEVAEKYQSYLPDVKQMQSLAGYDLKTIEIQEWTQYAWILYTLEDAETHTEILLSSIIFQDNAVHYDKFNQYEHLEDVFIQNQKIEIYSKSYDDGQIGYLLSFEMDAQRYYVEGKQEMEFLKQVVLEYYNTLSN